MDILKNYVLLPFIILTSLSWGQTKVISFEDVNVIPMNADTVLTHQRVIIASGKIAKIESVSHVSNYDVDTIIQASGKYLIPGLVETHYHLQNNVRNEFKLLVANGITSARNMAEYDGQDHIAIKEEIQKNSFLAPYYYTTGPYLTRNHLSHIDSVEKVVSYHKERGYDYLKIADNLSRNIYLKLLELTQKENIEVVGHGQRELPLEYSLRMKSIAHLEEFMNIFSEAERKSTSYLKQAAEQIKTSGIYVSPTLGIFEMISRYANNKKHANLIANENLKYLPKRYADYWKSDSINYRAKPWFTTEKAMARLEKELEWQKTFTKILHDHGVPLMAGSDTYGLFLPGFSLHHELELIHDSGLSTYETLKTATVNPARYLNTSSQSGTITEGKLADMVLLAKNPLEDIENTRTVLGVVLKGEWLNREKLDNMLLDVEKSYE
ncbi:amidohydrolase family protein [Flagellimonas sp.]|uniref:amidohydrolase family protein n=1 Tax=Flagellimonas sp. TaxID=2058762 RepID=UPI003B5AA39E